MHFKGNKFPINGLFRCTGSEIAWTDDWWAGMAKGAAEVAQVLFTATKNSDCPQWYKLCLFPGLSLYL